MRELLIITRAFPPKGGGGVQRMIKFATYSQNYGWNTKVVAPSSVNLSWRDETPLEHIPDCNIIRIKDLHTPRSFFTRVLRRMQPIDAFMGWAKSVDRQSPSITTTPTVVLSSGPPHSVHYAGMKIAKRFSAKWIADFRDHFTLGPEYRPVSPFHRWRDLNFEKQILDHADAIICNTRTNRREMIREFGVCFAAKLFTIYNGFDRTDLEVTESFSFCSGRTNYVYLGGLRGPGIDDTFFVALNQLLKINPKLAKQIMVHIVGDFSRKGPLVDQLVDQKIVELHSPVAANQIGAVLEAADACVVWQRDKKRYRGTVAGKIFDYLAMKKPVFAIGQRGGEVDRLVRRFGLGVCWPAATNPNEMARGLADFHQNLSAGMFAFDESNIECVNRFSRQHQVSQLSQLLDSLVEK